MQAGTPDTSTLNCLQFLHTDTPQLQAFFNLGQETYSSRALTHGTALMAESAGLALGAVALISLFQTAIEFFEYFEAARSLASDRDLATTKLNLLEARLRQWGDDLHIQHPGEEDRVLRKHWLEEGSLVTQSLEGISEILGNASQLSDKYGLHKKRRLIWRLGIPILDPILPRIDTPRVPPRKPRKITPSIRRQAAWAIKDKKRFESLISDLDFFVTNLEKVSGRLIKLECSNLDDMAPSNNPQSTTTSENKNVLMQSLARDRENRRGIPEATSVDTSGLSQETHHEYKSVQCSGKAFQPCGDMDVDSKHKHKYEDMNAKDFGYQPLGNGTSAGHVAIIKQLQEGYGK